MGLNSLHLCTSEAWGGLEIYACTVMAELKKTGCRVLAVCKPGSKVEEFLRENGIAFMHLPSYARVSFSAIKAIRTAIRHNNIDLVHVHFHKDIWPASLALRGDKKLKLFFSIYMGGAKKNDILHRFIYDRVDAVFSSSLTLNAQLPDLYPVPASKIHFLPYGRRIEEYQRNEVKRGQIRTNYGIKPDEIVIGTMVRIDPQKGTLDFANSFLYIEPLFRDKVKFMIVGEPTRRRTAKPGESPYEPICNEYLQEISEFIAKNELQDRVILTGFQRDLLGYLSAMDIFVFPSRNEMYSLAVLDAMGMQLPVVAARAGGNIEQIIDGVNGLFYEVANSKDLAKKLDLYLSQPGLRKKHGEAARIFVQERHSMAVTIKTLLEFYNKF